MSDWSSDVCSSDLHFPLVFYVCPWVPQTIMVVMICRLDMGEYLTRNGLQWVDISGAAIGLVHARRRGFHSVSIGKERLPLGIAQHEFVAAFHCRIRFTGIAPLAKRT